MEQTEDRVRMLAIKLHWPGNKKALDIPVIAVGRLDDPILANSVIGNEEADLVAVGRGMLRNPYWALEASKALKIKTEIPKQYQLGFKH